MRRGGIALVVVLASACGAKSNLLLAGSGGRSGAAGGAGSEGGAGVVGAAGAAGSGAEPPWATGTTCYAWVDRGSRLIDDEPGATQAGPELVLSSSDATRATLVYWHEAPSSPELALGQASFTAWSDWPATPLGQSSALTPGGGNFFKLARGFGDHFALFTSPEGGFGSPAFVFVDVAPGDMVSTSAGLGVGSGGVYPEFVARGDHDHLYGYTTTSTSGAQALVTGRAPVSGGSALAATGCATGAFTDALSADAVRVGDRYFVATTSSRDFGTCASDGGIDGPADRFQVALVPDSGQASLAWEWTDVIRQIALVPRSDGAWVVWQPVSNATAAPIMAARLDLDGQLVTLPNAFVGYGQASYGFAADRVADDLALAWIDTASPPAIHVALYDANALNDPHLETTISPAPDYWPVPVSLLGSPDGQHLLVSWEAPADGARHQVVTRRLDCIVPD